MRGEFRTGPPPGRRRRVAVAYGPRSVPVMQLTGAAADVCDLIWLVDGRLEQSRHLTPLLSRFGPVVDIGGLDAPGAARAVAPHRPDGLATYFDAGMVALAGVAERLDLPFHSVAAAEALTDKARQREILALAGVAGPPCRAVPAGPVKEALTAAADGMRWPAVLKPASESGSRHTFLVTGLEEAVDALEAVSGPGGPHEPMVLEEYLPGDPDRSGRPFADYVSVESVGAGDEVRHLAVTGRLPLAGTFRETGFFIPADLTAGERDAVFGVAADAIAALGAGPGCFHTEVKFTPNGPRLLEVNGRLGGGIPDMLMQAAGRSLLELSLRAALGQVPADEAPIGCDRVGYRLFLQPPAIVGRIAGIDGLDSLAEYPGVETVTVHLKPGDPVDWREGSRTYIVAVVGSAADHDGVLAAEQALHDIVHVRYESPIPAGGAP